MAKDENFYQISLKTILRNDKGEVLVLKAPPGSVIEGFWDLPGGRIDMNEFALPIPEIIARELHEELGDVQYALDERPIAVGRREVPPEFNRHQRTVRQLFLFFAADYRGGAIRLSDEHTAYRWINLAHLRLEKYFTAGILEGVEGYRHLCVHGTSATRIRADGRRC